MLELVAMLSLEVNEKEQAPLGQRVRNLNVVVMYSIIKLLVHVTEAVCHLGKNTCSKNSVATVLPAELRQLPTKI